MVSPSIRKGNLTATVLLSDIQVRAIGGKFEYLPITMMKYLTSAVEGARVGFPCQYFVFYCIVEMPLAQFDAAGIIDWGLKPSRNPLKTRSVDTKLVSITITMMR